MDGAASLLGQEAVDAAGQPPPAGVLLLTSLWGAVVAGWTINGVFALGEEYGWRAPMWDELRTAGPVRARLVIGLAWGVWHGRADLSLPGGLVPGPHRTGKARWTMRWKPVLNAFASTFADSWPAAETY